MYCVGAAYEQNFVRTMVFKRCQVEWIEIDGIKYEVTNSANQDHFDCKAKLLEIFQTIELALDDNNLSRDNFMPFKKELIGKLKDFEKKYVKHCKSTNPELASIHQKAMLPLVNLMESNLNLDNFRRLQNKQGPLPEFRKKALTERFIEHMTKVCDILKAFANKEGKTLDQPYDIRQMLEVLELDWQDVPAFHFYFKDLDKAFRELVDCLRVMHRLGPLRCSYYVEKNLEMTQKIFETIRCDVIVQELAADELKRDQFKEMYEVHKIVYNSALKDIYLDNKKNKAVMEDVIP